MKHPSEEQLVEFHYGEQPGRGEIEAHLRGCESCRANYKALKQVLAAVDAAPLPERDEAYGARVWRQLEPKLEPPTRVDWRAWLAPRRLTLVGAIAVLLVAAYFAGRVSPRHEQPVAVAPISQPAKERILLVAVGDHLDRSQMLLLELVNAEPEKDYGAGTVDISSEQERAEDLVTANRLYRQTALHSGDRAVASLLDELEPLLLEIAHSPSELTPAQLGEIRKRIEARGIIFKVRVISSEVRKREKQVAPAPMPGRQSS
jgi:hypothetical protein